LTVASVDVRDKTAEHSVQQDAVTHPIFKETDPRKIREIIRRGEWTKPTRGMAYGYTQANLAIVPKSEAYDFLVFCQRNPKPCPVLEVTEVGDPEPRLTAPGADIRTDLGKYRIFRNGKFAEEVTDLKEHWRDDFVAFLLGCSLTFEGALLANGVPIRQIEERRGPTIFKTNIPCKPAGKFRGPLVVSMRPMPPDKAIRAIQVTSRFPSTHGAPVHVGDPSLIGIEDINNPDWGVGVTVKPGEVPVFWACGVTPQAVALEAKVEIMITHSPGCMFIMDIRDEQLTVM
jgi:uncharacterized protein YcsI (UPF0317 family)